MTRIDDIVKSDLRTDKYRMFLNLVYTSTWMTNRFDELIRPLGLLRQQFNILRILHGAKGWMEMTDAKSRMLESSVSTSRHFEVLVEKRLIERKDSEKRGGETLVRITQFGEAMVAKIGDVEYNQVLSFLDNLTDDEARVVSDLLDKLRG